MQGLPHPQSQHNTPAAGMVATPDPRYYQTLGGPGPGPEIPNVQLTGKTEQVKYQYPLGLGQGINALLKFCSALSNETPVAPGGGGKPQSKLKLEFWNDLVAEYFTPEAVMRLTLWKENKKDEAKPFEIGVPIMPRFFLVTTQSGVKSMSIQLDGVRERIFSLGHSMIECNSAVWSFKYTNGYIVHLRGPFTVHMYAVRPTIQSQWSYRIDEMFFDAENHEKYLNVDSILGPRIPDSPGVSTPQFLPLPLTNGHIDSNDDRRYDEPRLHIERATVPAEPVNAFGIPQATMRCLELAESVGAMGPLIEFASLNHYGPLQSLEKYALKLREERRNAPPMNGNAPPGDGGGPPHVNGAPTGPSTIYAGTGPAPPAPGPAGPATQPPPPPHPLPQNAPPAGTPQLSKAVPPGQAPPSASGSASTPGPGPASASTPAAASTPATTGTGTPAISHANLKRKATTQGPDGSSAGGTETTAKRPTRKRGRTGGQ